MNDFYGGLYGKYQCQKIMEQSGFQLCNEQYKNAYSSLNIDGNLKLTTQDVSRAYLARLKGFKVHIKVWSFDHWLGMSAVFFLH